MSISVPISVGVQATSGNDLGPFNVQGDIVFSGGSAWNYANQPTTNPFTQTPTDTPTAAMGSASPNVGVSGTGPGSGTAITSSFLLPLLLLAGVGVGIWYYMKHKK